MQNYYSQAYFFTDCFWRSVNGFILLFIYEKQSDFRDIFENKMVFKIYIESLKTICEGVAFLFKFQVGNLKLYQRNSFKDVLNLGYGKESRYILVGGWGGSHITGGEVC